SASPGRSKFAPGARGGHEHVDNPGMTAPACLGSAFTSRAHPPGPRLARAQRFAALLTLSLYALGAFVPGDAIARAARARAEKTRRESGWCSYYGREFFH